MIDQIGGNISASPIIKEPVSVKVEGITNENQTSRDVSYQSQKTAHTNQKEHIEKIVDSLNDFLTASPNTHLKFEFHDKLNEYYVTIVDENTKEVVREIPPKKMLDMFAAMTEFLGLMVDKKI